MRRRFGLIGTTLGFFGLGLGLLFGGCSAKDEEQPAPAELYQPAERSIVTEESRSAGELEFLAIRPGVNKNTQLVYVTGIDTENSKVSYEVRQDNTSIVEKTSDFNPNTGVGTFELGNSMTANYRVNAAAGKLQADVNRDGDITSDSLDDHIAIEGIAIPVNSSFQIQPRTAGPYWSRSEVPFPMAYTFLGLNTDKTTIVLKDDSDGLTEFDISTGLISTYQGQHPFRVVDSPDGPKLYVDLNADGDFGLDPLEGFPFITEEQKGIKEGFFFYVGDAASPDQFPLVYRLKQIKTMNENGADELEFIDPEGQKVLLSYDTQTGQGTFKDVNGIDHTVMVNTMQDYILADLDGSGLIEQGRDLAANNANITAPRVSDEATIVQSGGYTFTKIPLGAPRLVIYTKNTGTTPATHQMTDKGATLDLAFDQSEIPQATYINPDGANVTVYDQGAGVTGDWNSNNTLQDKSNVTRR